MQFRGPTHVTQNQNHSGRTWASPTMVYKSCPLRLWRNPERFVWSQQLTRKASNCPHIMVTAVGLTVQADVYIQRGRVLLWQAWVGALCQSSKNPQWLHKKSLVLGSEGAPPHPSWNCSSPCLPEHPCSNKARTSWLAFNCPFHLWETHLGLVSSWSKKAQTWQTKPYNLFCAGPREK